MNSPVSIVIFGASGDLTKRKLVPALFNLRHDKYLPDDVEIIGFARREKTDDQFRDEMRAGIDSNSRRKPTGDEWSAFAKTLSYHVGNVDDLQAYKNLTKRLEDRERKLGDKVSRLYYLAVAPEHFLPILDCLSRANLLSEPGTSPWTRVVIEKPFGHDLESARNLNKSALGILDESQIFRIDHYLGKETVQNILSFRFGNEIFEPLFSQHYVEHIQITAAETLGMEGRRGAYYDTAGAIRDVVQNHVLQLLCLVAMEPPASLEAKAVRDEKVKVLSSIAPFTPEEVVENVVRGQYTAGTMDGVAVKGYREEEGVKADSATESYVAIRLNVDNWRWAGVPFLLRAGKRLQKRVTEIAVQFKRPPLHFFTSAEVGSCDLSEAKPNALIFRIQPDEGISLSFACKVPGMEMRLRTVSMDFLYGQSFNRVSPEAYERLLLDALRGDSTLFTRSDEVEYAWRFVTSILDGWKQEKPAKIAPYAPGSWGPTEANRIAYGCHIGWREPFKSQDGHIKVQAAEAKL
jgi:glucose-6-phosphate 1-dehydrogenase